MPAETTFDSTQGTLDQLLKDVAGGKLQLPDFQRGWVWDDSHIKDLITSVSRAFPVGAIMLLQTGGEVRFQPRLVEGVTRPATRVDPEELILDGQQRLTSLFQALRLDTPVQTRDDRGRVGGRWYYVDIAKALGTPDERESAVFSIREDRKVTRDFDRVVETDLSQTELECAAQAFPLNQVFHASVWRNAWNKHWSYAPDKIALWDRFEAAFVQGFLTYQLPIIRLRRTASKEAVCLVFEKVNQGGVPLTAFELVTASFAADDYNLREDWFGKTGTLGRAKAMAAVNGLLSEVASTDFLQAVSLLHTFSRRQAVREAGGAESDAPPVSCTRQTLLNMKLAAYTAQADRAEEGFRRAAQFLWRERIFTRNELPYRTQLVPLAAILASLEARWQDQTVRARVRQWFWCGVFGELYGSAIESRFAKDLQQVVPWALGHADAPVPATVLDCNFVTDRLLTMRTRLSAAYKGLSALVMQDDGALDWRTGAGVEEQIRFGEQIDVHHIFPRAWCEKTGKPWTVYDSIVNKTPLSRKTNIQVGGEAPSEYSRRLERREALTPERLDGLYQSHLIDPEHLRSDDFWALMRDRAERLSGKIAEATGRPLGGRAAAVVFAPTAPAPLGEQADEKLFTEAAAAIDPVERAL